MSCARRPVLRHLFIVKKVRIRCIPIFMYIKRAYIYVYKESDTRYVNMYVYLHIWDELRQPTRFPPPDCKANNTDQMYIYICGSVPCACVLVSPLYYKPSVSKQHPPSEMPVRETLDFGFAVPDWPLQDIILRLVVCARINRSFIIPARLHCPHCFKYYCTTIGQHTTPPPTLLVYDMHHTILVITISCKGQVPDDPSSAAWLHKTNITDQLYIYVCVLK